MNLKTAFSAAKFINEKGITSVNFFGGEPLFNPKPMKAVLAKTNARRYGITTNGTILTKDLQDWISLHNVGVALSFDGNKELQDKYRDHSYDRVMKNISFWKTRTNNVLMTLVDPKTVYDQVKSIRDLGFKAVFMNLLHPFGYGYSDEDLEIMEDVYRDVIKKLHDPPSFKILDFLKMYDVMKSRKRRDYKPGCGINRKGLGISVDGGLYPCHRAMEMGEYFKIGDIWNGVDFKKDRKIREQVSVLPEKCKECGLGCLPCPVNSYRAHGEFGVDPDDYYCEALKTRVKVVNELAPVYNLVSKHPVRVVHSNR